MPTGKQNPMPYRDVSKGAPLLVVAFKGKVFGLSPDTGELKWEFVVDEGEIVELYVDDELILAACHQVLAALEYPTGHRLWDVRLRPRGRPTLVVQGNRIVVGSAGEVMCHRPPVGRASSRSRWHRLPAEWYADAQDR